MSGRSRREAQVKEMGQYQNKLDIAAGPPVNVPKTNGSILCDIYIPDEVLTLILSYADKVTIAKCKTVCKKWHKLIKNGVWKVKAEREKPDIFESLTLQKRLPWNIYHSIIWKDCFGRNLLKNDSGKDGFKYWQITSNGGNQWKVENPPLGLERNQKHMEQPYAFVTSYGECKKKQVIDLYKSGLSPEILDTYQPDIFISELYAGRWDCDSHYRLDVELLNKEKNVVQKFHFHTDLKDWPGGWQKVEHTFRDYGKGVKFISFNHMGVDARFWAGHYGSKMTKANVEIPVYTLKKMQIVAREA